MLCFEFTVSYFYLLRFQFRNPAVPAGAFNQILSNYLTFRFHFYSQVQQFLQYQQAQQAGMQPAAPQPSDVLDLAALQSQLSVLSFDGGAAGVGAMHGAMQPGHYQLQEGAPQQAPGNGAVHQTWGAAPMYKQ